MNSAGRGAAHISAILQNKKVKHVVICPGSRNAPLIIALTSNPFFQCYSIVDERSAGFFALGVSQTIRSTVAVVCTSGSALLNLGPSIAEAFYQRLPLLVISADRPLEWIGQGESQTMQQGNIFSSITRASFDLIQDPESEDDLWFHDRQLSEAVDATIYPNFGPVHVNVRFREPLYLSPPKETTARSMAQSIGVESRLDKESETKIRSDWNKKQRVVILCGQMFPDEKLISILGNLASNGVVVLVESTSNLNHPDFIQCIDRVIIPHGDKYAKELMPDLVVSIGGPLVSRKIKELFRAGSLTEHWHIDPINPRIDSLKRLKWAIQMQPLHFLSIIEKEKKKKMDFLNKWRHLHVQSAKNHISFLAKAPFCDLKAFELILQRIPKTSILNIGNSSAIRYAQLFETARDVVTNSNRGTSGIEGSVSTAVGASVHTSSSTFLLAGDLSVLYDGNGLWNSYTSPKLKIIVINNGGGGIFRIIEGPKSVPDFEKFIETRHKMTFEDFARFHHLSYHCAQDEISFRAAWKNFLKEKSRPALLEIDTRNRKNDEILMNYFRHLRGKE